MTQLNNLSALTSHPGKAEQELLTRLLEHVDPACLAQTLSGLAAFGLREDGGVSRQTLCAEDLSARRFLVEQALALGCTVSTDACANLFFRREGRSQGAPVLTGSHADTQPIGGTLDGAYGVVAGLEVIRALNNAGIATERPVEVVAWTNEEGSRFGPGCMGSSAFVRPQLLHEYRQVRDSEGTRFGDALDAALKDLPHLEQGAMGRPIHAYVELHIEQGPVLEQAKSPLGIVTGIQGVRWFRVHVQGVAAHAGTTPMSSRADAMAQSIGIAHEFMQEAHRYFHRHLRMTIGRWNVRPNSINTIASDVEFSVDARCEDDSVLAQFADLLMSMAEQRQGPCRVVMEPLFKREATRFSAQMERVVAQSCFLASELAKRPPPVRLVSGAFHDAMYLADHCPAAMIFVPSVGGISHNATEYTNQADLILGVRALAACVTQLAGPVLPT